jgi:hypothetical protein
MSQKGFALLCLAALLANNVIAARVNAATRAAPRAPVRATSASQASCASSSTAIPVATGTFTATVAPSLTNPAITGPNCPHYIALSQTAQRQPELFVFLPGSNQEPLQFQMIVNQAAANGYYAIGLAYPNSPTVESICEDPTTGRVIDPTCHEAVRSEIIAGVNSSPLVTITVANSISGRLRSLLGYLHGVAPNAGWDQFQTQAGAIKWDKIRISGFSQGSGHAGLIAARESTARMCSFSGPSDAAILTAPPASGPYITATVGVSTVYGVPASWVTSTPATPAARLYSFRHEDDAPFVFASLSWGTLGHLGLGGLVSIDSAAPPYSASHTLTTQRPPTRPAANAHNMIVVDDQTPLNARGNPVFGSVWQYLCFDNPPVAPQPDPDPLCQDQCPDYGDAPDSSNPFGNPMSIHPNGAIAQPAFYPTFFTGAPGTGPRHNNAGANPNLNGAPAIAIDSALGLEIAPTGALVSRVSNEAGAALLPDQDNRRNLIPAPNPAFSRSNRDGFDNAFTSPTGAPTQLRFAPCQSALIQYAQFVRTPWAGNAFYTGTRFVNVWIDFNRDGDWADNNLGGPCPVGGAPADEWFIRNVPAPNFSGVFMLPPRPMPNLNDGRPMWLRISIADSAAPQNSIGNGPANGYRFGETEDHLICLVNNDASLWQVCPGGAIDANGAQGGQFIAKPRQPITFSVDIDESFAHPITITWEARGDGVRVETGLQLDNVQAAGAGDANRVVVQRVRLTPVPTTGNPEDKIVLGWYGCLTCTLASAASAQSAGQIDGPAEVSVTIQDATGARFSDVMNVQVGWRAYVPMITR